MNRRHFTLWINVTNKMLSENQTEKNTYNIIPFIKVKEQETLIYAVESQETGYH